MAEHTAVGVCSANGVNAGSMCSIGTVGLGVQQPIPSFPKEGLGLTPRKGFTMIMAEMLEISLAGLFLFFIC